MIREKRSRIPLRWSMMVMLVSGWLLPLLLIAFSLLYFVSDMIDKQIEKTIYYSTEKAVEICEMQISAIMSASKNASYNNTIKNSYEEYQKDGRRYLFKRQIEAFLNEQYKYDSNFLCTMVYLLEEPEYIYFTYNTYRDNNEGLSAYSRVTYFEQQIQQEVLDLSEELDTKTTLLMKDGRLYMVRNLVNSDFKPYAMIVIELSPKYVFESLKTVWGALDYEIYLDGESLVQNEWAAALDLQEMRNPSEKTSHYLNDKRGAFSFKVLNRNGQEIIYLMKLDPGTLIDDLKMLWWILALVLVFMVPLVILVFHFFHTRVSKPIASLVDASQEIGEGNYGHLVKETGNSREFDYLEKAFNSMSMELKYQFEQIYLEELALRDANIMALQSQINPHFLNNTLEIINWEARMNGNEKVSCMIEALATMLNATMNRKQKRFIPLSEELAYVDAYLYIIKQRFGERFQVSKEIDEHLLEQKVPPLIIQPIVENAVEHGINGKQKGQVILRIYSDEKSNMDSPSNESEELAENDIQDTEDLPRKQMKQEEVLQQEEKRQELEQSNTVVKKRKHRQKDITLIKNEEQNKVTFSKSKKWIHKELKEDFHEKPKNNFLLEQNNRVQNQENSPFKMYIEIINNGALSEEDQSRIDYLLGENVKEENEHHVSLGIRNVDRRLKIIYGENCGLSIKSNNKNQTVSTIIVKLDNEHNNSQ